MAEAKDQLYDAPVVSCPSVEELTKISEEMRLKCSAEDIETILGQFKSTVPAFQRVSHLQQPSLPVKYPRTPGYQPAKDDNPFNAWYWRCDIKGAEKGKLAGKKIGIKDNIAVAGVPMMNGSRILEGYTPEYDATVVTRILDAGGHILGKTNCEHLSLSGGSFTCDNGPVRNPHDETRNTGGSSSGSGALVAAGQLDMALGGDQGGSIRIPASWCGIVGLKPTHGLVPYTGAMPIEITMDHLGPMTKTVFDCALMLEVLAGYDDGRDPRQLPHITVPEYTKELESGISGKKIGVLKEGFDVCTEPDVVEIVRREVDRLKKAGAEVEEVSLPTHLDGPAIWNAVILQGAYNCMVKGNGNGLFWKGFYGVSLQEAVSRGLYTRPQDMSGILKSFCLMAEYMDRKYENKFYAQGQNLTMMLTRAYDSVLAKYDVLVMPTLPYKASKIPSSDSTLKEQLEVGLTMITNTCPFDSTGHPALSINAGFSEGLPIGMMIVGRHYDETTILKVARAYEKIRDTK
ncbi:amidase-like [Haliotis rufescens]|uniref:amidase-like n=1 Tax=Haliotis rufescens TaxID=6454 RepID=UPI001EB00013|nr:amidase-like [Haliotis rufescens]